MRSRVDRITTTIQREWLARIIAREKTVEYRAMKPYWRKRLEAVSRPFELRLINGMQKRAPEVTVLIDRVRGNRRTREYGLHIQKILGLKNWDARRRRPR
jgi:hypothetical protein